MVLVGVQCRLSSSRLPRKALLPLGESTVLDWTLSAMKKVNADEFYVATDEDSFAELEPIAKRNGYKTFVGSLEDVLQRYCSLIELTKADIVVRATADNPFLIYESAQKLLDIYTEEIKNNCDYITYTGLPHGCGVEIFSGKALLKAKELTNDPYDHEHVGPSLYKHKDIFNCIYIPAPKEWNYPNLRTTIDTEYDYKRAVSVVESLNRKKDKPLTGKQIIEAFTNMVKEKKILCVPCVRKGKGTGHLRRCLSISVSLGADIYIPDNAGLEELDELITEAKENGFDTSNIVKDFPEKDKYSIIVTDAFTLDREFAIKLSSIAPVIAIDEGSLNTDLCDYLLDIIPSYGLQRPANIADPSYVTLPKNKRTAPPLKNKSDIKEILITVGGEDPADLVVPATIAYASLGFKISAIVQNVEASINRLPEELKNKVTFFKPIHNLREQLYKYDLVVTHYGFTAFESLAAGCGVVLLGTTPLHVQLAKSYGFFCIPSSEISSTTAENSLSEINNLYPESPFSKNNSQRNDLSLFVKKLSTGSRLNCPICRNHAPYEDFIVARTSKRTFRRCHNCGLLYMAWSCLTEDTEYDEKYFFENYKKQYGKTYLDDFSNIKSQCIRRTSIIDYIYRNSNKVVTPTVLDIGCAYGAYLDAANEAGWQVFGTDISAEAVAYVQDRLHYPATCSKFPEFDSVVEFGVSEFDAVTMWYVIEHFQDLNIVLKKVSKLLKKGGVFAFSTPSASGVTGRFNPQKFYQTSPADHYSLLEPTKVSTMLKKYGFRVEKIVSTGHHPERFPNVIKEKIKPNSIRYALYAASSRFFGLGDTFEVYCRKEYDL